MAFQPLGKQKSSRDAILTLCKSKSSDDDVSEASESKKSSDDDVSEASESEKSSDDVRGIKRNVTNGTTTENNYSC